MLNITKEFPGIKANDDITLQVKKGEIHALLGENGAGKSTLMSILFGLYQPDSGIIRIRGQEVHVTGPRVANDLGIGMTHQHFKLVHNFTVLQSIILGVETVKAGFLKMDEAREKIVALSEKYGLKVDPDAMIEDITVGMQQRVEILKMLYRDNDILIFDEPTAVLTPHEIDDLMDIMSYWSMKVWASSQDRSYDRRCTDVQNFSNQPRIILNEGRSVRRRKTDFFGQSHSFQRRFDPFQKDRRAV